MRRPLGNLLPRALPGALLATLLLAGCGDGGPGDRGSGGGGGGGGPTTPAELADVELTRSLGCGEGFHVVDEADEVALVLAWTGSTPEPLPAVVELPAPDWFVEVRVGSDLTANHCTDVILEPEAVVEQHWPVVAGTLTFEGEPPPGGPVLPPLEVSATLSGIRVDVEGEVVAIDDLALESRNWGFHPG